ncbi:MAG: rhodanese-like domain-containing protein [Betaproteobacteria bacterium]
MKTSTRIASLCGAIAAAALVAALVAAVRSDPAQAQGASMPAPPGTQSGGALLDRLMAWERQDMGVTAPRDLHDGPFHGPTPNQIPGGQVIATKGLLPLLQQQGLEVHLFDVLGGAESLPNAIPAAWASTAGNFEDPTQQRMAQMLRQVTRGKVDAPVVFYCLSPQCWMSYNAALRAIRLGYKNVLWYRGGVEAWKNAGLPLGVAGGQGQPQAQQQGQPQAPFAGGRPPGALPPDAFGAPGGRR